MIAVAAMSHAFYTQQALTTRAAVDHAQKLWSAHPASGIDVKKWNDETLPLLLDVLTRGQLTNATRAREFQAQVAKAYNWPEPDAIDPQAFLTDNATGSAMLNAAAGRAIGLQDLGMPALPAQQKGLASLVRTFGDLAQDSGAVASSVQLTLAPQAQGYYRQLVLPSCERCAVLAGIHSQWEEAFLRHPGCDCTMVPAGDVYDDGTYKPEFDGVEALSAGQITGLSKGDKAAILDGGADFNQVVNAKRSGMRSEVIFGKKVQTTTVGTTSRGNYGRQFGTKGLQKVSGARYRVAKMPRLTPSEIYKQAGGDRDHARRLLKKYGYTL